MHLHTGPTPGIMVRDGTRYHSPNCLVRIACTLNSLRYISEVLESVDIQWLPSIELFPWPTCFLNLSLIAVVWIMLAQRPAWDTPPAATSDQLWKYVEAAWTIVPQGYT
ncbi:transposable element Tcb1 transposase [Trichonephila clavipes]|nr:transposable element Tcb1 transposase [Trichonephila clavipes]